MKSTFKKLSKIYSKRILHTLQNNIQETITNEDKDDKNEINMWIQQIIKTLEINHVENLNKTLSNTGNNSDDKEKVIPANVWIAMVDEA